MVKSKFFQDIKDISIFVILLIIVIKLMIYIMNANNDLYKLNQNIKNNKIQNVVNDMNYNRNKLVKQFISFKQVNFMTNRLSKL